MNKHFFSASAAWIIGLLAAGSIFAQGHGSHSPKPESIESCAPMAGDFTPPPPPPPHHRLAPPPPPPHRPKPAEAKAAPHQLPLLPWEMPAKPSFAIEKVMGLDTPPPVPAAPAFKGIEDVALPAALASDDPGSVLELWFRKEGVSEKDIKKLDQLPADQKALIRKIVQAYQIDMQRTVLEMRPNYQKIRNDLDMLKLDLSRLILISDSSKAQSQEVTAVLDAIALKEAELASLQGVQDKITGVFEKEMTDQITEVVNAWISAQASKTKESLSGLFKDADNTYGLKWE